MLKINFPIRVLHIISNITENSGVAKIVMNYYENIDKTKVQFDFLFFSQLSKSYEMKISNMGGRVFKIVQPSFTKGFYDSLDVFFKSHAGEFQILHNHEVFLTAFIAPVTQKYHIKNFIIHAHATRWSDKKISAIRNSIMTIPAYYLATNFFCCSQAAGDFMFHNVFNLTNKPIYIMKNAINIKDFSYDEENRKQVRCQYNIDDKLVIGNIAGFRKQKNHEFLIRIFKAIIEREKQALLILVGTGPLMNDIKTLVRKLNLDENVLFLGQCNNIFKLLQGIDHFILPSIFEGLPMVGVEAQASGVPITMSENITREIGVVNYQYLDLSKDFSYWADSILDFKPLTPRKNAYVELEKAGFEISKESEKLEEIYLRLC